MGEAVIFGIRHLSPAGAWHLRKLLDEVKPQAVLIEGPSDFTEELAALADQRVKPPIAIMAYTEDLPIRTILYPLAEYSPEYQAALWAYENKKECRFIDLPSSVFLAVPKASGQTGDVGEEGRVSVYRRLDELSGDDTHETFWERTMEHFSEGQGYQKGAEAFGRNLRELTEGEDGDYAETLVREAYMEQSIQNVVASGIAPENIVVVTGAYHVEGLKRKAEAISKEEWEKLPSVAVQKTLMPYSYYRLSSRSGYGAGNKAPAYYGLLWQGFLRGEADYAARSYLSRLAAWQRKNGNMVSSAEVIEAVRLSVSLANLHGYQIPSLRDLRDAAVTCMGHGRFGEIAQAVADTEIGTAIGSLPQGVSKTSIQNDFYRMLDELNLRRYCAATSGDLHLDLREKLTVKSQKSAFLDLERSFFLHRLRVLGISFVDWQQVQQERATWAEHWVLRWTPEAEIEIVEAQLKGDTILQAASFQMKEEVEREESIAAIAKAIEASFFCGMPETVSYATAVLQKIAVDAAAVEEIAKTVQSLSVAIQYGSIRKISSEALIPVLGQLFLRACLLLPESCVCDDNASREIIEGIARLNEASLHHDFLPEERWLQVLEEVAGRDDLNTKVSGYAAAILLERGKMSNEELEQKVEFRLSKGIPADLGASWFEGLSMKNRYALIARMGLWESLDHYLESLDDEEFKRALIFLRRAFADFTAKEKSDIAENLGELWQLNPLQVSEAIQAPLDEEAQEMLGDLEDFDFGDI
ncbi:DUF5682 family protein [Lachnospiraceae bacterium 29-84]